MTSKKEGEGLWSGVWPVDESWSECFNKKERTAANWADMLRRDVTA